MVSLTFTCLSLVPWLPRTAALILLMLSCKVLLRVVLMMGLLDLQLVALVVMTRSWAAGVMMKAIWLYQRPQHK